ncbi:MAG: cupin domain-containing protein [Rhizobiales bacterium]|nr:cupin domain-containing protein [Hyphomicrobiales bacterium]
MSDTISLERTRALARISNLDALYAEADRLAVTPGWIKREKPVLWREPKSDFLPMHWRYQPIKDALEAAGGLIDVALAERRNLILRNPIPDNSFATTRTLVCAYQMILPGEMAPSHRHSSHALRVILDARGSFSTVNGEKTPMETGDVVLTPGWCWHGHGHDGEEPAYWFDGLDVPLTHLFETMFFEEYPDKYEPVVKVAQTSPYRFARDAMASALDKARPEAEGLHGPRIDLDAPDMRLMGLSMERLEAGRRTRRQRSTVNRLFVPVEGRGETIVDGERFAWQRGDCIAVPCWHWFEHRAAADSVVFEMSDEPLMRFAQYYRFEVD